MLSRSKYAQLAAVAALTILFGANASMNTATAQTGVQLAQADQKDMQKSRRGDVRPSSTAARPQAQADQKDTKRTRKENVQRLSSRDASSNRSRKTVSSDRTRHTVAGRTTTRTVVRSDHDRRRVVVRSRPRTTVAFVVLGPRVAYRAYGAGWCRGLHRGTHWAPRIGWHSGRHYGPFRC